MARYSRVGEIFEELRNLKTQEVKSMTEYTITWEVAGLQAVSPIAALLQAIEMLEQRRSTFTVTNCDTGHQGAFQDPRGYDRADWQKEVAFGETDLGFADWIAKQQEV